MVPLRPCRLNWLVGFCFFNGVLSDPPAGILMKISSSKVAFDVGCDRCTLASTLSSKAGRWI